MVLQLVKKIIEHALIQHNKAGINNTEYYCVYVDHNAMHKGKASINAALLYYNEMSLKCEFLPVLLISSYSL